MKLAKNLSLDMKKKKFKYNVLNQIRSLADGIEWGFVKVEIDKIERNKEDV